MVIIGVDPGYAIVGLGLVEYANNRFRTLYYNAVVTEAHAPFAERLAVIYSAFGGLLDKARPDAMAIEKLFFTTNQKTAIDVAQARGVVLLAAQERHIPIFEYTPLQVKSAVVGYGKAVKKQVQEMTKTILGLATVPKPDDIADALAIAICHGHTCGSSLAQHAAAGTRW